MIAQSIASSRNRAAFCQFLVLGGLFSATLLAPQAHGQTPATAKHSDSHFASRYASRHLPKRATEYYSLIWGVDSLSVKAVESGALIRFSYRMVDPVKAAVFTDKKMEPFLDAPYQRVRLVIPSLEKVGQLRQLNAPKEGNLYWMAFSNPRRTVKRGDRVNLVIGSFHANGLVVE